MDARMTMFYNRALSHAFENNRLETINNALVGASQCKNVCDKNYQVLSLRVKTWFKARHAN